VNKEVQVRGKKSLAGEGIKYSDAITIPCSKETSIVVNLKKETNTEKRIKPYFKIEVMVSFFGLPISKIPKLTITKEIPSSERQILIIGEIRDSKLKYLIMRISINKIDSIAATSIATEKAETPRLSFFTLLSIRCVKKTIKSAQTILRII